MRSLKQLLQPMNKALLAFLLILVGCQEDMVYHSYQPVAPTGWDRTDALTYTYPQDIPAGNYEFFIGIRHKDSYLYRDIWLAITQGSKTDTLHLYLADEKGNWLGHGIGELRQYVFPIHPAYPIEAADTLRTIHIRHIMKDQPLAGIHDIGVCLKQQP